MRKPGSPRDWPGRSMKSPSETILPVTVGRLIDTIGDEALGLGNASFVRNCRTSRGRWELSPRHRRFKSRPVRTVSSGDAFDGCTEFFEGAQSIATVARSTSIDWVTPTAAAMSDDSRAGCSLEGGQLTDKLVFRNLFPEVNIPAAATIGSVKFKLEHSLTGTWPTIQDLAFPKIDGVDWGTNIPSSDEIPSIDTFVEYEIDTDLPSVSEINDGKLGIDFGYQALGTPDWNLETNWIITRTADGTTYTAGDTGSRVVTITAVYDGPGSPPPYVYVAVDAICTVAPGYSGEGPFPFNYEGEGTADNGLGTTQTGDLLRAGAVVRPGDHPNVVAAGSGVVKVLLSGGTGTYDVTGEGSIDVTGDNTGIDVSMATTVAFEEFTLPAVYVDSLAFSICYTAPDSTLTEILGSEGIGYGDFAGAEEVSVIHGKSIFDTDANDSLSAMSSDWLGPRYPDQFLTDNWCIWQYGKWLFYTSEQNGVFFKEIGSGTVEGLFRDYDFAGNVSVTGIGFSRREWVEADDVLTVTTDHDDSSPVATVNGDGEYEIRFQVDDRGDPHNTTLEWEFTAGGEDWSEHKHIAVQMLPAGNYPEFFLTDYKLQVKVSGSWLDLETKQFESGDWRGSAYVGGEWVGNTSEWIAIGRTVGVLSPGDLVTHLRVQLRGEVSQNNNAASLSMLVGKIIFGGGYLCAPVDTAKIWDASLTKTSIEYFSRYKKISTGEVSSAQVVRFPADDTVGPRIRSWTSPVGQVVEVSSAGTDQAPFVRDTDEVSPDIVIQFIRKGSDGLYYLLGEKANNGAQKWLDSTEEFALSDLAELTDVTLGDTSGSLFGIVKGITCGCSWKNTNVYAGNDGKIYFSRSINPKDVLWEGIVLTNDQSSNKTVPRTDVLADNTSDYAIAMVAADNLYCFTSREAYVFIGNDTPATASFSRKIDGARGVVGAKAAALLSDRAIYGAKDGLWLVRKNADYGSQPDELLELTNEVRDSWLWLLGDSPSTTVVETHLGDIWCLNRNRALYKSKEAGWVPIEWADARQAVNAVTTPFGLFVQMTDGSVCVIGDYTTDGASNLDGSNGMPVTWIYRTGNGPIEAQVSRVKATANGSVSIEVQSNRSSRVNSLTSAEEAVHEYPVSRAGTSSRVSDQSLKIELSGLANSYLSRLLLVATSRTALRANE